MPKNRLLPRSAFIRTSRSSGWYPSSTTPIVDQISPYLGDAYAGSLTAGENQGLDQADAKVVIGEKVRGIQMQEHGGGVFLSATWGGKTRTGVSGSLTQGGYFRLGLPSTPGLTFSDGVTRMEGDVIIDGTLSVDKLILAGNVAKTFLNGDYIWVGTGDAPPMKERTGQGVAQTGTRMDSTGLRGYYAGDVTWFVSDIDGLITSQDDDDPANIYSKFGAGKIQVSNHWAQGASGVPRCALTLRSVNDLPGGLYETSQVGIWANLGSIHFQSLAQSMMDDHMTLELSNRFGVTMSSWAMDSLILAKGTAGEAQAFASGSGIEAQTAGTGFSMAVKNAAGGQAPGFGVRALDTTQWFYLRGLGLQFEIPFASRPATPYEGFIHWDSTNHRLEIYTGTAWQYINTTAA